MTPATLSEQRWNTQGELLSSSTDIAHRMLEHFAAVEGGAIVDAMQVAGRVHYAESQKTQLDLYGTLEDLPRFDRVRNAIGDARSSAAAGPDRIGHCVYSDRRAVQWSSAYIWSLAVKQTFTLVAPIQYRGGGLFALWKRAAALRAAASHRAIFLGEADGKVVAKSQRADLSVDVLGHLDNQYLTQCGGLPGRGTDVANVVARATFDGQAERNASGAGLFVDIVTAFYSIIRGLAVPVVESDLVVAKLFYDLNLSTDTIHELAEMLADPDALQEAGVSGVMRHVISLHFEATFFEMEGADGIFGSALAGTRPGHPFADLIFSFVFAKVAGEIGQELDRQDLLPSYPCGEVPAPFAQPMTGMVKGAILCFIDDAFLNLELPNRRVIEEGFAVILELLAAAVAVIVAVCRRHGLSDNFKQGKTEAIVHYTVQPKKARLFLADHPTVPVNVGGDATKDLCIVAKYKHLGGIIKPNGDMYEEVVMRAGASRATNVSLHRSIFGNKHLFMSRRLLFWRSLSCSKLLFNQGTWSALSRKALTKLDSTFHQGLKRVTLSLKPQDSPTNLNVRAQVGMPTVDVLATCARLTLLRKVVQFGSDGCLLFCNPLQKLQRVGPLRSSRIGSGCVPMATLHCRLPMISVLCTCTLPWCPSACGSRPLRRQGSRVCICSAFRLTEKLSTGFGQNSLSHLVWTWLARSLSSRIGHAHIVIAPSPPTRG